MRPPEFTGGNELQAQMAPLLRAGRFNEAAGIHRRKPQHRGVDGDSAEPASMRPPEFTGGNSGMKW